MQLWRHASLRRFAGSLMLLAALAFVNQGAISAVSQAAAAMGLMPEPAVTLSGPVHYHGNVARHVHTHDGDQVGHVHDPLDIDSDDGDKRVSIASVQLLALPPVSCRSQSSCPLLFESVVRIAASIVRSADRHRSRAAEPTTKYPQHRLTSAALRPPRSRVCFVGFPQWFDIA